MGEPRRVLNLRRLAASPLTLGMLILSLATFDPAGAGRGIAGLTQCLLVLEIHASFVLLGFSVFRYER